MSNQKQSQVYRLAAALSNTQRWRDLTDEECESAAAELRRLNVRVLELEAELVAEAARTAEATLRADQMTDQHRMQCNMREQGWQPIDSAPKDGTEVLLFGLWAGEINGIAEHPSTAVGSWTGGSSDYGNEGWWYLSSSDAYASWMQASHWMPLPKPPAM